MNENGEGDVSYIRETDFPVHCDRCGHPLDTLGEHGSCPNCGMEFDRRERLWQTYGPDAFARPPVKRDEYEPTWTGSAFVAGTLFGLILAAIVPVAVWVSQDWLGVGDPWFVLFAWAVLAAAVIWLVVSRYRPRGSTDRRGTRSHPNGRPADALRTLRSDTDADEAEAESD